VYRYRDAWKALGNISKEEAMMHYVLLVNKLDPAWKDEASLQSTKEDLSTSPVRTGRMILYVMMCFIVCCDNCSYQMVGVF